MRVLTMMGGQFDLAARGRPARAAAGARARREARPLRRGGRVCRHCRHPGGPSGARRRDRPGSSPRIRTRVLEIANEPVHPSQSAEVQKPDVLKALAARVPSDIPVALGSIERGDGFGDGELHHLALAARVGQGGWSHVHALAEGAELLARWKKPVISDEPIGAGPAFQPGRRDNAPARFRAAALLTRLVGLGATFHYEARPAGARSGRPGARMLQCLERSVDAYCRPTSSTGAIFSSGGAADGIVAALRSRTRRRECTSASMARMGGCSCSASRPRRSRCRTDGVCEKRVEIDGGRLLSVTRSTAGIS